jgi:hypothetical protein
VRMQQVALRNLSIKRCDSAARLCLDMSGHSPRLHMVLPLEENDATPREGTPERIACSLFRM